MQEEEFDKFADEYYANHLANIRLSGERPEYFAEYKVEDLARLISPIFAGSIRILDFGCGIGNSVPWLKKHFPASILTGVDVSMKSLALAESRFSDMSDFVHFNGHALPFNNESFDAVIAACVFHHIPSEKHHGLLSEIYRVLKKQGHVLIHEHNPLNPLTRHAVNTCPFDSNAVLIRSGKLHKSIIDAGFTATRQEYRVFFPKMFGFLRPLETLLKSCPLGAQYFVSGVKD
jgi:ubiquinone/menaquinone biosynthesis C-methylase UbiE